MMMDYNIFDQDSNVVIELIHPNFGYNESQDFCVDIIEGCTDNAANNFNEIANLDDGSCDYNITACDIIPSGLNVNNIIHNRVTFNWIAASINPSLHDKFRQLVLQIGQRLQLDLPIIMNIQAQNMLSQSLVLQGMEYES